MFKKKILYVMFFCFFIFLFTSYSDTLFFDINYKSRKIMVDGFLFEWKKYNSKNWNKSKDNSFDIAFTSEGWCGYITFLSKSEKWEFLFSDSVKQYRISFFKDSLYTVPGIKAAFSKDNRGLVIIEWLLIKKENEKNNFLILTGSNSRGDTLPLIFTIYKDTSNLKEYNQLSYIWIFIVVGVLIFLVSLIKRKLYR